MYLAMKDGQIYLGEPDHFRSLDVRNSTKSDAEHIAASLAGHPDEDGAHIWVEIAALRHLAGRTDAAWGESFDAMIAFAADHGWTRNALVRLHIAATDTHP